ncbi:MAG: hypothetical protein M1814_005748 [Vezdaea aestivalis]|nr:MAG: hypothetical protein M1814_005748 [Vezdaea aestivalis]
MSIPPSHRSPFPIKPSPKRKRAGSPPADFSSTPPKQPRLASPTPLEISTPFSASSFSNNSDTDFGSGDYPTALESSPRSKVARSLHDLQLEVVDGRRVGGSADVVSKGSKSGEDLSRLRSENLGNFDGTLDGQIKGTATSVSLAHRPIPAESRSIADSKIDPKLFTSSPPISTLSKGLSTSSAQPPPVFQLPQPPPLAHLQPVSFSSPAPIKATLSAPSPDQQQYYWQDHEITGHIPSTIDDVLGLNGVGFKPTPAMAWARTQKRRAQVLEYRAREAREERRRRGERRAVMGREDHGIGRQPDQDLGVEPQTEADVVPGMNASRQEGRRVRFVLSEG